MRSLRLALAGAAWICASPSLAGSVHASLTVSAVVEGICSIAGGDIAFGAYTPTTTALQQGALTVNCTSGTAYVVSMDGGAAGNRQMAGPNGGVLPYELYTDSTRSQRWGSGASAETGTGTGAAQSLPIYARVSAASAAPGSYTDVVTATLTY